MVTKRLRADEGSFCSKISLLTVSLTFFFISPGLISSTTSFLKHCLQLKQLIKTLKKTCINKTFSLYVIFIQLLFVHLFIQLICDILIHLFICSIIFLFFVQSLSIVI